MMQNVLITSVGRRVSLVRAFQNELRKTVKSAKVFTADLNPDWSAACAISDGFFSLPPVTDPSYIDGLLNLCLTENISLVIPTIDTELQTLADNRIQFKALGINIAVSDSQFVAYCRDKRKTGELFAQHGIEVPISVDKFNPTFPLFVKPYDGSLSKDIQVIKDRSELNERLIENEKLMFMEYLSPEEYQEFTVDAYYENGGHLICLVPRRRIEVRGGEISKGRTERGELYKVLFEKFQFINGARSCLTMQFFQHRKNCRIVGIEINPRFGGGYPLSYAAQANYPSFLIREYILGEKLVFEDDWINGLVMLRYDAEIIKKNVT